MSSREKNQRIQVFNRLDEVIMELIGKVVYERKNHLLIVEISIGKRTVRRIEVRLDRGMRAEVTNVGE